MTRCSHPDCRATDQGKVKQKLTKNTAENVRGEELEGKTPTNTMLFGTPSKLFDGHEVENAFQSFLDTGYARRCWFAWGEHKREEGVDPDPKAMYYARIQPQNQTTINKWSGHFALLADPARYGWEMEVPDDVAIELLTYKLICEARADTLPSHDEVRKAELAHRYFKVLKLAGAFAFVDESSEVTMDHLHQAIKLAQESGVAFERMLSREKPYVKLARYIAESRSGLTHADLHEALPFYKESPAARNAMMNLAMSWGYNKHIVIRKSFAEGGIELFTGETLKKTDLTKIRFSWSDHMAYNYNADEGPFDQIPMLTQAPDLHWSNHQFDNGHRSEENVMPGFNMVVIDVDGGVPLTTVHELMKDYVFMTYTTKRHTAQENRFRLLLPINYTLELDKEDYRQFMDSIMDWLPFATDEGANQRSKKWLSHEAGTCHVNMDGQLLDCLSFIPRSQRNDTYQQKMEGLQNLDNLERWFAQRMESGNRNNQLLKYAMTLVDAGLSYTEVEESLLSFSARLPNGLSADELRGTILVTVAKKIHGQP